MAVARAFRRPGSGKEASRPVTLSSDKATRPLRIAVCICTYNRPEGLKAVLAALDRQRLGALPDDTVEIVVIDNSTTGDAAALWQATGRKLRFPVAFGHEPRKGLAFARNAALTAALQPGITHIAFIDDDELPGPEWIVSLRAALERKGTVAAIGPVLPVFAAPPPFWLPVTAFADLRQPSDGLVDDGYTCNAIIARTAIDALSLSFDARFNDTGGEDTMFFKHLIDSGGKIVWAENAVVYAPIPAHRMRAQWLWRRWYRTGDIEASLGRYNAASFTGKLYNLARGLVRIGGGGLRVAKAALCDSWRKPGAFVASFYTLCRGAGLIASVGGVRYKEYVAPDYR
jgi:glycosyltransferase involved in cell wall biosynthesis